MTPPEHLFIGFSLGNIMYSSQIFFKSKQLPYIVILLFSGIGAIMPDIDSFFGNYFSKDIFMGHRGITHTFLFVIVASTAIIVVIALSIVMLHRASNNLQSANLKHFLMVSFSILIISGFSHVLADLPQPPGVWGGIPIFFPLSSNGEYVRTGGWSKIGWYDYRIQWSYGVIFLISFIFILLLMFFNRYTYRRIALCIAIAVIILNLSVNIWAISYMENSTYVNDKHWRDLQVKYLNNSGTLIKTITLKGEKYFLNIFKKVI